MRVTLEHIESDEQRQVAEILRGTVVEHIVLVGIDGQVRRFRVFVKVNVLASFDASVVYGDPLLEELLRFEPVALNRLYSAVGRHRRGLQQALPLVLLESGETEQLQGIPASSGS